MDKGYICTVARLSLSLSLSFSQQPFHGYAHRWNPRVSTVVPNFSPPLEYHLVIFNFERVINEGKEILAKRYNIISYDHGGGIFEIVKISSFSPFSSQLGLLSVIIITSCFPSFEIRIDSNFLFPARQSTLSSSGRHRNGFIVSKDFG